MTFNTLKDRAATWTTKPGFVFCFLLLVSILAYGLLIPWLHLYIDDWIWVWTWEKMGRAGLVKYFSTNRPFWGLIFQVTLPLLGRNIIVYHLFSLVIRWCCGLACWWLVRLLWPRRAETAFISALFFVVYPGFALQPIALTYGHLFLIYLFFLLSLCFNLLALRKPHYFLPFTILAVLLSAANLMTMEYFFTLELTRPLLLWFLAADQGALPAPLPARKRLLWVLRQWLPYLILFTGVAAWRAFIFKVITNRYPLHLIDQIRQNPAEALLGLGKTVLASFWNVTFGAWLPVLSRLGQMNLRLNNSLLTIAIVGIAAFLTCAAAAAFFRSNRRRKPVTESPFSVIILGLSLLLMGGWPVWLTGLKVQPVLFDSRLTIPFILGAGMLFAGLLSFIRSVWARSVVLALLVGLACGYHFQNANTFRMEAEQNRQLMWQIAWRIPNMVDGTTLLITDFPVTTYNTATLLTEINMIYPTAGRYPDLAYDIQYDRELDQAIAQQGSVKGTPISDSNVTSDFSGSTAQVLSAQYNLSQCFRLLDPSLDSQDASQAAFTRQAAKLSDWKWIITDQKASIPPAQWFGSEPPHGWCYYFEKAELARQKGDWAEAARLGDAARSKGLAPRDDMEKLVFIEAYARTSQWERSVELSKGFQRAEKQPVLCDLWQRILQSTPNSSQKASAVGEMNESGICLTLGKSHGN